MSGVLLHIAHKTKHPNAQRIESYCICIESMPPLCSFLAGIASL